MKILALKLRRLGDTALWTAALEALWELRPETLAIGYPDSYDALFTDDSRFQRKYPLKPILSENKKILREIQSFNFDAVLNFHASPSSARFCKATQIKRRLIHFHERKMGDNTSDSVIPSLGKPMSAMERDLNLVRALGWAGKSPEPRLIISEATRTLGRKLLQEAGLDLKGKVFAISVGASRLSKRWPIENYLKLCSRLKELGEVVILTDQPNPLGEFAGQFSLYAKTLFTPGLTQLLACVSQASCFIGSDSGVKHVAAALSIPTVTLFGPESVGEWHGYSSQRHPYLQLPVPCRFNNPNPPEFSWCGESICPLGSHACLSLISPTMVFDRVAQLLLR